MNVATAAICDPSIQANLWNQWNLSAIRTAGCVFGKRTKTDLGMLDAFVFAILS